MMRIVFTCLLLCLPLGVSNADDFGAMFTHAAPTALEDTYANVYAAHGTDDAIMPYDIEPAAGVEFTPDAPDTTPQKSLTHIVYPSNTAIKTIMPEGIN